MSNYMDRFGIQKVTDKDVNSAKLLNDKIEDVLDAVDFMVDCKLQGAEGVRTVGQVKIESTVESFLVKHPLCGTAVCGENTLM